MGWKKVGTLLALFIGGYIGVFAATVDPSRVIFDWNALVAGLIAAGLAQPALSDASITVQVVSTIGAFLVGYGTLATSIGYRYVFLHFDARALLAGLGASGLIHANNPNVVEPVKFAARSVVGKP